MLAVSHEFPAVRRVSRWMKRIGWSGLWLGNPGFVLAAVVSWSSHVMFAHCSWCESREWESLRRDAGHILVVLAILGLGFARSAIHMSVGKRLPTIEPARRRRAVLAYVAVAVLHTLMVSVWIRHATAPLIAVLFAWPITLLFGLRREAWLCGEPLLPAARVVRAT